MAEMPGVIASYYRTGRHYTRQWRIDKGFLGESERRWFHRHGQKIADTEAATYGPDVIGLLRDNSSYGVAGDHGGAQKSVQRIPIVFYGAPGSATTSAKPTDLITSAPSTSCRPCCAS